MFVVGTVAIGPNVVNDGAVVMSEGTMAEVFGSGGGPPAFIGIQLVPGADPTAMREQLNKALSGRGEVITRDDFEAREKTYWSRETPVGYITDLGFVMG
jgi:putative ABC transport system permease protein